MIIENKTNEERMKLNGEDKIWKEITSKSNLPKRIPQTQIGLRIIFNEALDILDNTRDWIDNKSAAKYKTKLKNFFVDDDFLLLKITESFLILSSSIFVSRHEVKKIYTRHKDVRLIQRKIMEDLPFELVWRFLEIIIDYSRCFEINKSLSRNKGNLMINLRYSCTLGEEILLNLAESANKAFFPEPMLTPPIDWSFEGNELVGGYEFYQYDMIRSKSYKVNYSRYSDEIFESINYIQSIPWRINAPLLDIISADLEMPQKEDFIKSVFPDNEEAKLELNLEDKETKLTKKQIKVIQEARIKYYSEVELYNAEARDYESTLGKYRSIKLAIKIARNYKEGEIIYFPHSYDFRGRIYPIPVVFSPQGSDAVKSMLEYAQGEKLTKEGEDWCWAYMSSLYGEDKMPFEERIIRGKELMDADYREADEPYQFLAHQIEMTRYLADNDYEVVARIHMDACNSGSQFTSAITGDRAGCIATNVIPTINEDGSHVRQDAYMLVVNKSLELIKTLLTNENDLEVKKVLRFFRKALKNDGRKICKRPVMVSNYGGTAGGRADIIWNILREMKYDRSFLNKKNSALFSKIVGDSTTGVLRGGKAFEIYIQKMNLVIARKNKAIMWHTSDGFYVKHVKFKEIETKQVVLKLPGARKSTTINVKKFSKDVNPTKMRSAISPNYIHSLDAELLRIVALRMMDEGIAYSDWIHDSFGCHPNHVSKMIKIIKEEFKNLVDRDPLKELDNELREQTANTKATQKRLDAIKLPRLGGPDVYQEVIESIEKSNWFFS